MSNTKEPLEVEVQIWGDEFTVCYGVERFRFSQEEHNMEEFERMFKALGFECNVVEAY